MQYLVLAYGGDAEWKRLSKEEQQRLLQQDEVLRHRGDLVAAVAPTVTVVRAHAGTAQTTIGAFAAPPLPLAGFGIIDASSLEEAVKLVADTPCARAGGAVELRQIMASNDRERLAKREVIGAMLPTP